MTKELGIEIQRKLAESLGDKYSISLEPYCLSYVVEIRHEDKDEHRIKIPIEVCALCENHAITPCVQNRGNGSNSMRIILM